MWNVGLKQGVPTRFVCTWPGIGHPLLGDTVYGSSRNPYHLEGQALHAMILGFVHPRTGEYMEFTCPTSGIFC